MQDDIQQLSLSVYLLSSQLCFSCFQIQFPLFSLRSFLAHLNIVCKRQRGWPTKWPNLANGVGHRPANNMKTFRDQMASSNVPAIMQYLIFYIFVLFSFSTVIQLHVNCITNFCWTTIWQLDICSLHSRRQLQLDFVIDALACKYYCLICHKANVLHTNRHSVSHKHRYPHMHTHTHIHLLM